jgi:high-affinity nickel-transport protein
MSLIRIRGRLAALDHSDRRRLGAMASFITALHLIGWGTLIAIVVPQHLQLGTTAFGLGLGVTAYVLGLRHAFDADHIAAIDNTTRAMMGRGQRPLSVGFWFSLGHSSVVFALALLIAAGARAVPHQALDEHSHLQSVAAIVGTTASAGFLFLVAAVNLVVFVRIWRLFRQMRTGRVDQDSLDAHLDNRGLVSRLIRRLGKPVDRPWRMYVVGLLFGLGFDTATEIALLVLAGAGAATGVPWYATLCVPVLFAAGMSLADTLSGAFMNAAYGWALAEPVRKIYVNLTMTALSIAAALAIATAEVASFVSGSLRLDSGLWSWTEAITSGTVGWLIIFMFAGTWLASILIWRYGRIEEKWSAAHGPSPGERPDLAAGRPRLQTFISHQVSLSERSIP